MRFPTMRRDGLHRPIIALVAESLTGTRWVIDALVDMGSDRTLFPERMARSLGIDLVGLPSSPISSALGSTGIFTSAELILELRRSRKVLRWRTAVGFVSRPMSYGILGTKGFFEFFKIKYNWPQKVIDIEPAGPLPL
jgi:hypothetical protein